MDARSTVIGLKAKTNAAQQLAKLETFSEPLSERQREMMMLLLASAYMDGMIAGIKELGISQ